MVDTIAEVYRKTDRTMPASVGCHSTWAVANSRAALRGVPLSEICAAATWASPCMFTRFYRIDVAPISLISFAVLPENL